MAMTANIGFDRKISRPAPSISSSSRTRTRRRRRRIRSRALKHSKRQGCGGAKQSRASSKAVAQRLAALRSLIPPKADTAAASGDRLLEDTAEYILLLRTQVEVLKGLVDVYSPCVGENYIWKG